MTVGGVGMMMMMPYALAYQVQNCIPLDLFMLSSSGRPQTHVWQLIVYIASPETGMGHWHTQFIYLFIDFIYASLYPTYLGTYLRTATPSAPPRPRRLFVHPPPSVHIYISCYRHREYISTVFWHLIINTFPSNIITS